MNRRVLEERLEALRRLAARPGTLGEREAALSAIRRIEARLAGESASPRPGMRRAASPWSPRRRRRIFGPGGMDVESAEDWFSLWEEAVSNGEVLVVRFGTEWGSLSRPRAVDAVGEIAGKPALHMRDYRSHAHREIKVMDRRYLGRYRVHVEFRPDDGLAQRFLTARNPKRVPPLDRVRTYRDLRNWLKVNAEFVRRGKHGEIWEFPNGSRVQLPGTPGDRRSLKNSIKHVKHAIGRRPPVSNPCPDHGDDHPSASKPVSKATIKKELGALWNKAGLPKGRWRVKFPESLKKHHRKSARRYAQVRFGETPTFELAEQICHLPKTHRRAILAHEIGHVLDPDSRKTEAGADRAVREVMGIEIEYDKRFPGKGLQATRNPRGGDLGFQEAVRRGEWLQALAIARRGDPALLLRLYRYLRTASGYPPGEPVDHVRWGANPLLDAAGLVHNGWAMRVGAIPNVEHLADYELGRAENALLEAVTKEVDPLCNHCGASLLPGDTACYACGELLEESGS